MIALQVFQEKHIFSKVFKAWKYAKHEAQTN
jgi:hypothetical protein